MCHQLPVLLKHQGNRPHHFKGLWVGASFQVFFKKDKRQKLLKRDKHIPLKINCILLSNKLILYVSRQLINHVIFFLLRGLSLVTSGLYYQCNQDSTGRVIYTKGNYFSFWFNFIHAFLGSCYLNAHQTPFLTSFLRLQKVEWNTLIMEKTKEKPMRYRSLLMQPPRRTSFMHFTSLPTRSD